jgi:hypothetical protein
MPPPNADFSFRISFKKGKAIPGEYLTPLAS